MTIWNIQKDPGPDSDAGTPWPTTGQTYDDSQPDALSIGDYLIQLQQNDPDNTCYAASVQTKQENYNGRNPQPY